MRRAALRKEECGQVGTWKKFLKEWVLPLGAEVPVSYTHLKRRIMDMGITKGTSIFVRKVAPLGDPVEITVRGYELSIRKGDAENILVE